MIFLITLACMHSQAVWETSPKPVVAAATARLSVVVSDRRCQDLANALAIEFSMRPGVEVVPDAPTRLLLNLGRRELSTEIDVSQTYSTGSSSLLEQRDQAVRANGMAVMTIEVDQQPVGMVNTESSRVRMVREGDPSHLHKRAYIRDRVVGDMANDLAQKIAPLPEVVRRRWYRNPDPGTAKDFHNRAVDAERSGDFSAAIRLATQSMNASRTPRTVAYLRDLEARRSNRRFVEKDSSSSD